jgi:hypothetical protein
MTSLRLTPEHEIQIRAELRKSGRVSALDVAYLIDELYAVSKEREELWMLLDNIDTLDDACRSDDARFRRLTRRQQRRRFDIHNPENIVPAHILVPANATEASTSPCCHGAWEADENGVQCCVFCGVTADLANVRLV